MTAQTLVVPQSPGGATSATDHTERPATTLLDVLRGRPGWPLVLLFVGFPIWWVLGIADVMTFVAAGGMAYELLRRRSIRVPKNIGVLLLFLAWVALGIVLVHVDVPGAVHSSSATRYLTWAWRLFWYLKATILLLYLGNERHRLSLTWICRVFGWMFVVIVAGGLLGVLAPTFQFQSLTELVLPKGLTSTPFVHSLIHPVAAEAFTLGGGKQGRTSAPFAYSNVWGLNFACFLPFFMVAWFGRDAGWRRIAAPFVLTVALVPVVFSLNRALWVALVAATVFVAVRSAIAGRTRALAAVIVGSLLFAALLTLSPLGRVMNDRLSGGTPTSDTGRANLSALSLSSMERTSPLLGFGTTRAVQGNFESIAGGATAYCPRCALPSLGTQGQFSLVTFTQGIVGAVLYFGFVVLQFLRHIRVRSRFAVAALAVLLVHLVTSTVYSADNLSILAIFGAVAVAWRAHVEQDLGAGASTRYAAAEPMLSDYTMMVAQHRRSLAVVFAAGLVGGTFVAYSHGVPSAASVSIVLSDDPEYPGQRQPPTTLDTIAAMATSTAAQDAMRTAQYADRSVNAGALSVTAAPNTRILRLTYVARSQRTARSVVSAVAQSVLSQRTADLERQRMIRVATLTARDDAILTALQTVSTSSVSTYAARALSPMRDDLKSDLDEVNAQLVDIQRLPVDPGVVAVPVTTRLVWDGWKIDIANGAGIAVLVWAALAMIFRAIGPRVDARGRSATAGGFRLVGPGRPGSLDPAMIALERPAAVLAASARNDAVAAAAQLDALIDRPARTGTGCRVIIVSADGDPVREAALARRRLEATGAQVAGMVIVHRARPADDEPSAV